MIATPEPKESGRASLDEVRAFWDANPCGAWRVHERFGTPEFYDSYRAYRYGKHWHLPTLAGFDRHAGKSVLEIGCGLGADGARFAQGGARYTGVDLTEVAVEATRQHFQALGLDGEFLVQNAENMTGLRDASFDVVYSHGVLHHTPNLGRALEEVARVLKPGGELILMLYHRHSFNYYARILGYQRALALGYVMTRPLIPRSRRRGRFELHYQNYRRMGAGYFRARDFAHRCADGVECPIAYSYSRADLRRLLQPAFTDIRFAVAHLPIRETLPFVSIPVEKFFASRFGWYLFTYARKR